MREAYEDSSRARRCSANCAPYAGAVEDWSFPAGGHRARRARPAPHLPAGAIAGASARRTPRRKDARAMHQWRKRVKDLRYATEALDRGPNRACAGSPAARAAWVNCSERTTTWRCSPSAWARIRPRPLPRAGRGRQHAQAAAQAHRPPATAAAQAQRSREGERLYALKPKRFVRRRCGAAYARASRV